MSTNYSGVPASEESGETAFVPGESGQATFVPAESRFHAVEDQDQALADPALDDSARAEPVVNDPAVDDPRYTVEDEQLTVDDLGSRGSASPTTTSTPASDSRSATDAVADVAGHAQEAAANVAGTAKDEASKVAQTAKTQIRDLSGQTRDQLVGQAGVQQERVAKGLHSLGDELSSMAGKSETGGVGTDLVGQAAGRAKSIASWLDDRDPGTLLEDITSFARDRPALFIGLAAAAGVVAGRLTRSLASSAHDEAAASDTPTERSSSMSDVSVTPVTVTTTAPMTPSGPLGATSLSTASVSDGSAL
ncbi:MAG: hypothetical protein H7146_00610 [Burkholderiaceae bacterium]|nr:hypothetical protein [Microbacteriaceae bacterium]